MIYFIRSYYCSVSVFTCNSASLELPPTIISKFPAMVRMVFVCASHHSNCLGVNSNSTLTVFPAGICIRLKARSVLTGPSASSCFFRYTCTTSSPSRLPVLVTGTIIFGSFPYFNRLLQFDVTIVKSGITQTITEWEKRITFKITVSTSCHIIIFKIR